MIIFAPAVIAAIGIACKNIDKSIELDEKALKRLRKAYNLQHESKLKIEKTIEQHDKALEKLLNRKLSITQYSLRPFVDVFSKIKKVEFDDALIKKAQINLTFPKEKYGNLMVDHNIIIQPYTGKEAIVSLLKGGFTGLMVDESKREVIIAGKHLRIAEAYASNADNICMMLNHIIDEANKISDLLASLNLFLLKSIKLVDQLIDTIGYDKYKYTTQDREIIKNTINIAMAVKDIIDCPVIDEEGNITEQLANSYKFAYEFYMIINGSI